MMSYSLIFWIVSVLVHVSVNGNCIRHIFEEGIITSDNYPYGYERGLKCRTWIHSPIGNVANITVVDLDVTSSSNGDCMDSVRIFDGYRSTDPLLATLCGSVTSGSYRTSQSKAYIAFKTDRLNDGGTGYKFRIAFLDPYQSFTSTTTTSEPPTTTRAITTANPTTATTTTTPTTPTLARTTTATTTSIVYTTTPNTPTTPITNSITTNTPTTSITNTPTTNTPTTSIMSITTTNTPTTSITTTSTPTTSSDTPNWHVDFCGQSTVANAGNLNLPTFRIYGGIDATVHEFPWQVLIMNNNQLKCGGSVINKHWIITAAHCRITSDSSVDLIVGAHRLQGGDEPNRQVLHPASVHTNPNFTTATHDYDIALIRTEGEIQMNNYVQPICPPNIHEVFANKKAVISGWGKVLDETGHSVLPNVLQYTTVNITTLAYCREKYRGRHTITDHMVCATDNQGETERDTCSGDSGGPMVVKRADDSFVLVGITSFGIGCSSGYPGVYSRVSYLLNWIQGILDAN